MTTFIRPTKEHMRRSDLLHHIKCGKSVLVESYQYMYCICQDQSNCVHSKFETQFSFERDYEEIIRIHRKLQIFLYTHSHLFSAM
jgi:hypothetical protein